MKAGTFLVRAHEVTRGLFRRIRQAYFRKLFREPTLELYFPFYIHPIGNVVVGRNVAISAFVHIVANGGVSIGDCTIIAAGVQITSSTHDVVHRPYRGKRVDAAVWIGSNVWIGAGAVILPGITIGDNAVIGAGSVVTRDVPANMIFVGMPARPLRSIENAANPK